MVCEWCFVFVSTRCTFGRVGNGCKEKRRKKKGKENRKQKTTRKKKGAHKVSKGLTLSPTLPLCEISTST